jgi:murein DD-endopeptidase MepM/ murein hydrolase activator NlpD
MTKRSPSSSRSVVARASGAVAVGGFVLAALASGAGAASSGPPKRPDFRVPLPCGAQASLTTYVGHNPDDKKIDIFRKGVPKGSPILASAAGYVHEQFAPGGIEIDHGNGWFSVYLHL